jgi:CHRD domain
MGARETTVACRPTKVEERKTYVVPEGAKFTDSQYASYLAGRLYINVHSVEHKGGEIRGQVARQHVAVID